MLELYTFSISHFSEKARWMLDSFGIAYREVRWTPFFHVLPALRLSRQATTVPILRHAQGVVQDSTRILLWLDANEPRCKLLPADPAQRAEVLALEDRFDRIGFPVLRVSYAAVLDDPALAVALWTPDASALQRRIMHSSFGLLRAIFRRRAGITPARVQRAEQSIADALDELDARLADGRRYLVGDRLSAADITACALLAPLFGPPEHPLYGRPEVRAKAAARVAQWADRPAARWVLERYREDRRR
jgi:glutathione S-transferase